MPSIATSCRQSKWIWWDVTPVWEKLISCFWVRLILGGCYPTGLGQKLRAILQEKSHGKDLWVEQISPWLTARDLGRVAVRKWLCQWPLGAAELITTLWHLKDGIGLLCCLKPDVILGTQESAKSWMTARVGVNFNGSPPGDYLVDRGSCNSQKCHNG